MLHLSLPLRVDLSGRLATVAQDSAEDVAQSIGVLLATRAGERVNVSSYGTPDAQADGPDLEGTTSAVAYWEPRVENFDVQLVVTENGVDVGAVS